MEQKERLDLIAKILDRAEALGVDFDRMSAFMDLGFVDKNIGLRLEDFLKSDDLNFLHDFYGIQKNFNRETKEMDNFFLPRFAISK